MLLCKMRSMLSSYESLNHCLALRNIKNIIDVNMNLSVEVSFFVSWHFISLSIKGVAIFHYLIIHLFLKTNIKKKVKNH